VTTRDDELRRLVRHLDAEIARAVRLRMRLANELAAATSRKRERKARR
jgi:hypothetical protein